MQSNPIELKMTEEEAEKLEVTRGFCNRKIGKVTEDIRNAHSKDLILN